MKVRIAAPRRLVAAIAILALVNSVPLAVPGPVAAVGLCPAHPDFATLVERNGVALCVQRSGGADIAYWTVVDFKAGARARLISQTATTPGYPTTQFHRKTAPNWYSWIQSNVSSPTGGALFQVTNASFFTNALIGTTSLSYPMRQDFQVKSTGAAPESSQKRWLGFKDNTTPYGFLGTYDYNGQNYTGNDPAVVSTLYTNIRDYVVSLSPNYQIGGAEQRIYVGFFDTDANQTGDRMVILQTNVGYTNSAASNALGWWGCPEAWRIQLDGGGSRQFYADNGNFRLDTGRAVPNVIAIWEKAP